uniref:MULE transposase domain-containing protein n=1 Tax=Globodera rostochiensis TaxID=31243 RepID=A0A914HIQ2_GLORO
MSIIVDHCAIPCAYGLLISKTAASYRIFFDSIRAAVGLNWYPIRIMADFEQAAISAAKAVSEFTAEWMLIPFWEGTIQAASAAAKFAHAIQQQQR